ncbi:MAG: tripartite tricarboxylate transporter TctB family protein [Treponema sp.]
MKKSDIGLTIAMYGIIAFFFVLVIQYKPEVRIYPFFVMAVLCTLNTVFLIKQLVAFAKSKKVENDYKTIFKQFELKQFTVVFLFSLIYVCVIDIIGFYPASVLYLIGTLLFLKVRIPYIALTLVLFGTVIFTAFSKFLRVPLPRGCFF